MKYHGLVFNSFYYGYTPITFTKSSKPSGGHIQEFFNYRISLGPFTRVQRDRIIELAEQVRSFPRNSRVNGCRVWLRDLLVLLVNDGMVSDETFNKLDSDVPAPIRNQNMFLVVSHPATSLAVVNYTYLTMKTHRAYYGQWIALTSTEP